ncbi:MAG: TonB-dependent receptor, partial [Rhizorhabdus sp.]
SQADPTNPFDEVGKYGLLNLYAGLRDHDGRWEVAAFAKNVTDIAKALSRSTPATTSYQVLNPATGTTTGVATTSTYTLVTSTAPREFGLTLRYNFGTR